MVLPQSVVVLGGAASEMAAMLRDALPELDVLMSGPAPDLPYAVIGFQPGAKIADYAEVSWVHISGAGADGMLMALNEGRAKPALITRTVGQMGRQIGEYVLSYVLANRQRHADRAALQQARRWDVEAAAPRPVAGLRAMIIGTGGIGSGVADMLSAVGMSCLGVSRSGRESEGFDAVIRWDDLPDVLHDVDVIVGALPLTPRTDRLIGPNMLARSNGALFINVGRGATADVPAVLAALEAGHLRHAVLDVLPVEPLPVGDPLWLHPKVTLTPHVSGLTQPQDAVTAFVAAYRALERGERPDLIVDPDAGY
ncbi:NAD(P)-dependent oxidoreductase [Algimonas porphyrae]|uniref:2-hydroxyacid dehydrogenase n=1 Tax=Algimonas porphyrae TaxID=1128113 RepID=A0ABQ5V0N1_9PROT|nr:NAD(P)-dependent oxidoreductase [Algimonas porphyrae]GLQ21108.1 2-hydroxyacid dehydrogenase [Algimonas porphyrae]